MTITKRSVIHSIDRLQNRYNIGTIGTIYRYNINRYKLIGTNRYKLIGTNRYK